MITSKDRNNYQNSEKPDWNKNYRKMIKDQNL